MSLVVAFTADRNVNKERSDDKGRSARIARDKSQCEEERQS